MGKTEDLGLKLITLFFRQAEKNGKSVEIITNESEYQSKIDDGTAFDDLVLYNNGGRVTHMEPVLYHLVAAYPDKVFDYLKQIEADQH